MTETTFGAAHGIYFISYAAMATIAFVIVAMAQYKRKKSEGIPINFNILKIAGGIAIAMWTGAALTSATYTTNPTTAAVAAFCVGIVFSIFVAWQFGKVVRKMTEDEKTIRELSTNCSLTNLWNRRVFQETISAEVSRTKRHGHNLSLLFLDVEGLGMVNKKSGYEAGDKVLRDLAGLLISSTRDNDRVCRYAGNQIAIILPDTDIENAEMFANRLREKVENTEFEAATDDMVHVTISVGVADYSEYTSTDASIVCAAYDALKAAQKMGPNHVVNHNDKKSEEQKTGGMYPNLPEKLELSIPVIDKDHDKLFSFIRMYDEAVERKDIGAIDLVFVSLLEYTKYHFKREEMGLKASGYQNLESHEGEHRKLEEEVASILKDLVLGHETFHPGKFKDVRTFLLGWLNRHIGVSDMSYRDMMLASPDAIKAMEEYNISEYRAVA